MHKNRVLTSSSWVCQVVELVLVVAYLQRNVLRKNVGELLHKSFM